MCYASCYPTYLSRNPPTSSYFWLKKSYRIKYFCQVLLHMFHSEFKVVSIYPINTGLDYARHRSSLGRVTSSLDPSWIQPDSVHNPSFPERVFIGYVSQNPKPKTRNRITSHVISKDNVIQVKGMLD